MTTYTGSIHTVQNKYIIISYKNQTVISRYVMCYGVSVEVAQELFKETLKFLYVRSQSYQEVLIPSKNVGQMWRLFLQDTQAYENFCRFYLNRYIHHRFNVSMDIDYSKDYENTLSEMNKHFSKKINFWSVSDDVDESLALKKDIVNYGVPQLKVIKSKSNQSGCIESFIFLLIISFFVIMIVWSSSYNVSS